VANEASITGIFRELAFLLADARREFALYTLVLGGLSAIGIVVGLTEATTGGLDFGFSIDAADTTATGLFDIASSVVGLVGTYLLLTRFLAVRGRLHLRGTRFWHYVGMLVLSVIAIVLGSMLLFVPGVILLIRWSAASGFVIGAGEGVTGSLTASWNATRGHSWKIFVCAIILLVAMTLCAGGIGALAGVIGAQAASVVSAFVQTAISAVLAAFGIAIYCVVHDESQELSEVFA